MLGQFGIKVGIFRDHQYSGLKGVCSRLLFPHEGQDSFIVDLYCIEYYDLSQPEVNPVMIDISGVTNNTLFSGCGIVFSQLLSSKRLVPTNVNGS